MTTTKAHRVGDATVVKILERALEEIEAGDLYPDKATVPTAVAETLAALRARHPVAICAV